MNFVFRQQGGILVAGPGVTNILYIHKVVDQVLEKKCIKKAAFANM
jgi:hypothetical protein